MLKPLHIVVPIILGIVLVILAFVGVEYRWYTHWGHLDTLFHFIGGIIAAWFTLALFQKDVTHLGFWRQIILLVSVAVFIGVVWEWAEYITQFVRDPLPWLYAYFHGGDLADTFTDLFADLCGAFLLTGWALYKERS